MAHPDDRMNVPARMKVRLELHPLGIAGLDQVIENPIGDLFVGDAAIAIAVDVELDGLELQHTGTGLIKKPQHRKIGITRKGTFAGEFGQFDRNLVRAPRPRVVKADQFGFGNGTFAVKRCAGLISRNRGHVRLKPTATVGSGIRLLRSAPGGKAVTMATSAGSRLG